MSGPVCADGAANRGAVPFFPVPARLASGAGDAADNRAAARYRVVARNRVAGHKRKWPLDFSGSSGRGSCSPEQFHSTINQPTPILLSQ